MKNLTLNRPSFGDNSVCDQYRSSPNIKSTKKINEYVQKTDSPNLMLANYFSRSTVSEYCRPYSSMHSLVLQSELHLTVSEKRVGFCA